MPQKDLGKSERAAPETVARQLDFRLETPASGFSAGVRCVKELGHALDGLAWRDEVRRINWLAGANMQRRSRVVAGHLCIAAQRRASLNAWRAVGPAYQRAYRHRALSLEWFAKTADAYLQSQEEFRELCAPYFGLDE